MGEAPIALLNVGTFVHTRAFGEDVPRGLQWLCTSGVSAITLASAPTPPATYVPPERVTCVLSARNTSPVGPDVGATQVTSPISSNNETSGPAPSITPTCT